jgi:WD40 repeat protein
VAPPGEVWQRVEPILGRFEEAWHNGQQPAIDDYLASIDGERRALLVELIHADLDCRLHAGQAVRVESYLERYPPPRDDPAVVLDLLAAEYLLRQDCGESVTFEEYQERFPDLATGLPRQVSLRKAGGAGEAVTLAPPAGPSESPTLDLPAGTGPARPTAPVPEVQRVAVPGYELLGVLGQGGMGVVYQARQLALGRVVALKVVLHGGHAGSEERRRFRAEAEAVARLKHPNVVQVYQVGEHHGLPFFSMEFCEGGSLDAHLDGTPWQPTKAAALVETLAHAMHAAHVAGVVHRDLKPANVLLAADGMPKVTDFGLAKRLDVQGPTQTGAVMGTPSYMAPEQAAAKKSVGPAADVWALGALLYELLTGRPPFKATTDLDTLLQVLGDEPVAVRKLQPKVPRDLETICHHCLQKDPKKRYASAEALAADLRRFGDGEPVAARPVSVVGRAVRWARRRPAVAGLLAAVALVAAAGLGGIVWAYGEAVRQRDLAREESSRADEQARQVEAEAQRVLLEKQRADDKAEEARRQAKRADDKAEEARREAKRADDKAEEAAEREYFAQIGRADAQLMTGDHGGAAGVLDLVGLKYRNWEYGYLRRRAQGTPLTLRGHASAVLAVCCSPDGTRIASASQDGAVKLWDARTGADVATLRGHTDGVTDVVYSPDGTRLATGSRDKTVKLWDATSGTEIATLRGHTGIVYAVSYSPDGTRLASASDDHTVKLWDTHSGAELATLRGRTLGGVLSVAWSPDGNHLASASADGAGTVLDARSGAQIATLGGSTPGLHSVVYSPDGTRLASASYNNMVMLWDSRSGAQIAEIVAQWPVQADGLSKPPIATLLGHTGLARSVAYSPDGTRLASSSSDNSVKVWDARTYVEIATLRGHSAAVTAVAYSPDGSRLVSASQDKTVKVWGIRDGARVATLRGHTGHVLSLAYSPDGTRIASASTDGTIKLWDVHNGSEITTLRGQTGVVSAVAYSPDGTRLASASSDATIKLWDATSGTVLATLRGHGDRLYAVCYSPDGTRLASAGQDHTVGLWDSRSGAPLAILRGHASGVNAVAWSPDGTRLATASQDGTVRLWDAVRWVEAIALPRGHTKGVNAVRFSPDGTRLASAAADRTIKLWDTRRGVELATLRGHTDPVTSVCYSRDGRRLISASADHTVKVWDARTGAELATLRDHTQQVNAVLCSPDGTRLASASDDNTIKLWDARGGAELAALRGHTGAVAAVAYSPDGTQLASASADATIKLWHASSGAELATLRGHTGQVEAISYNPDGTQLASASWDKTVKVWDAKSSAELRSLRGHTAWVYVVAYSPDGTQLASGSADNTVRLWDAAGGAAITTLRGHTGGVYAVAFSPDGRRLASASHDTTVKLWDARSGTLQATLRGHTGAVTAVVFSPDGKQLAGTSEDTVKLWDAATGADVATLRGHTSSVTAVAYSPDGSRIVLAGPDNTARVWDARTGQPLPGETPPRLLVAPNVSPDGMRLAVPDGELVRLWLRHPALGNYDPWGEDFDHRRALAPTWHAEDAEAAEMFGNPFAAAFHRRRLLPSRPSDLPNRRRLADACLRLGRVQEALDLFDQLLAADRSLAPAYLERARIRLLLGDRAGADADSLAALALTAVHRSGWVDVARAEAAAGERAAQQYNWPAARHHFGRAALWQATEPQHLWRLAGAESSGRDDDASRSTLLRLWRAPRGTDDLEVPCRLSAALACGWQMAATPANLAGIPAAEVLLRQQAARRTAVAVRAAALRPDTVGPAQMLPGGIEPDGLLTLARQGVAADPQSWEAREAFGAALLRANQPREAVRELEESIRRHGAGGSRWAQLFLALAYYRLGQNQKAQQIRWGTYGQRPADLLIEQLSRELSLPMLPAELEAKLPEVLAGRTRPASAAEAANLARLCLYHKRLYVAGVRLSTEAFAADPRLAENYVIGYRYDAACCAALAAAGRGHDAATLDAAERARLRKLAHDWLRADLQHWAKRLDDGKPEGRNEVMMKMWHWRSDTDLASVRDVKALAALPEAERRMWEKLWADVMQLLPRPPRPPQPKR